MKSRPKIGSNPVSSPSRFLRGLGTMLMISCMGALTPVESNVTVVRWMKLLGRAAGCDMFLKKRKKFWCWQPFFYNWQETEGIKPLDVQVQVASLLAKCFLQITEVKQRSAKIIPGWVSAGSISKLVGRVVFLSVSDVGHVWRPLNSDTPWLTIQPIQKKKTRSVILLGTKDYRKELSGPLCPLWKKIRHWMLTIDFWGQRGLKTVVVIATIPVGT